VCWEKEKRKGAAGRGKGPGNLVGLLAPWFFGKLDAPDPAIKRTCVCFTPLPEIP